MCFPISVFYPNRAIIEAQMTPQDVAMLAMILGVTHILARPLLGFIGNKSNSVLGKQLAYAISTVINGVICCVSVFFFTEPLQIFFIIVYGTASGK